MNKYITALLIVLATTGVEAQNYHSALKAVLGDVTYEKYILNEPLASFENELKSIIETIRQIQSKDETEPAYKHDIWTTSFTFGSAIAVDRSASEISAPSSLHPIANVLTGINIRAPSYIKVLTV